MGTASMFDEPQASPPPAAVATRPGPATRPAAPVGSATARATDPDTSHEAAESLSTEQLNEQCTRVLWAIVELHRTNWQAGATAPEIVMRLAYTGQAPQQSVVARRCTDLARAGFIVDSGERRQGRTGRRVTVWSPTPAGVERAS